MSETAQGAGWWRASDGKFYPPELHPNANQWGPPPGTPAGARQTNGFAIASLVLSLAAVGIGSILGVIFGVIARREIRASGGSQGGEGLAMAGLIIGSIGLAFAIAAIVLVAVLFGIGAFSAPAVSGAPGYTTSRGDHGLPLAEGHPWGRPCQPIVFQVNRAMPSPQYGLIAQAVESARSDGIDVTIETQNLYWYPSSLYPPGQTNASVRVVPIFASTASPPSLTGGRMEHIGFGWDTQISSGGRHEVLADLQATIYLAAVQGDPQATERSVRQLVAFSQGVTGSTAAGSSIASGNMQDAYSTQDLAAMQRMSGCTFEPTTQP
jgi:hypothetical protein